MGCWHGPHDCGPWHGYGNGWYGPPEPYEAFERPIGRPIRRSVRASAADDLEARLDALHDEIERVERELASLRGTEPSRGAGA